MVQKVVMGTRLPAKLWLDDVEDSCMAQIISLASLPFAFKHIAIMPDAHTGKGMPIGGVLATIGVVIPNAVGVDIGCGMCAVKTNLKASELSVNQIKAIMRHIRKTIPLGFDHQKNAMDKSLLPDLDLDACPFLRNKTVAMLKEIGTLGGGNHLLCERWYADTLPGLAFLPIEEQVGKDYMHEMEYCKHLAFANRKVMMEQVQQGFMDNCTNVNFEPIINIAHNYAAWENHFGKNVIVHRKGATRAFKGEIGIIPGSMGTKSYIVEGLGNPESFMSCSHGAGRKMSRSVAFKTLDLSEECRRMDEQGIIHGMRKSGLDEAPSAYKDIEAVIAFENDLIKPIIELAPLAVVKGD